MGSTTHIVDEAGRVCNRYEYDAWGNITFEEETVPNRFTYYGQQLDPITRQYYLRARFYNPVIGRFTQEDTYRGDGLNLYAYCANNPVFYVDPSGHDKDVLGRPVSSKAGDNEYAAANRPFVDQFGSNYREELAFNKEHGLTTAYDTPEARVQNERIMNQPPSPSANIPAVGTDELVTVYRGTGFRAEWEVYNETGLIMSDAARNVYLETRDIDQAYAVSQRNHDEWIKIWGDENTYIQAHGEFGSELSREFSRDRTMVSVTTDRTVAEQFAGSGGVVFELQVPRSQLRPQTIEGAGESEYLIVNGTRR